MSYNHSSQNHQIFNDPVSRSMWMQSILLQYFRHRIQCAFISICLQLCYFFCVFVVGVCFTRFIHLRCACHFRWKRTMWLGVCCVFVIFYEIQEDGGYSFAIVCDQISITKRAIVKRFQICLKCLTECARQYIRCFICRQLKWDCGVRTTDAHDRTNDICHWCLL